MNTCDLLNGTGIIITGNFLNAAGTGKRSQILQEGDIVKLWDFRKGICLANTLDF